MAVFALVTVAVACLEYFFFTNDFSLAYVVEHSNRALPPYYKFAVTVVRAGRLAAPVDLAAFDATHSSSCFSTAKSIRS